MCCMYRGHDNGVMGGRYCVAVRDSDSICCLQHEDMYRKGVLAKH